MHLYAYLSQLVLKLHGISADPFQHKRCLFLELLPDVKHMVMFCTHSSHTKRSSTNTSLQGLCSSLTSYDTRYFFTFPSAGVNTNSKLA